MTTSPIATAPRRRAFRDTRQRFTAGAAYVWRRSFVSLGKRVNAGDPVDVAAIGRTKLRRYWDAQWIELANWGRDSRSSAPPPSAPTSSDPTAPKAERPESKRGRGKSKGGAPVSGDELAPEAADAGEGGTPALDGRGAGFATSGAPPDSPV